MNRTDKLTPLKRLNDWHLEHRDQDIRNRPVIGPDGKRIGIVDDLLVDRSAERVAAITLEDGRAIRVEALEIRPDAVVIGDDRILTGARKPEPVAGTAENEVHLPIIEEELAVGKRAVEGGGIRVRSRVLETPVQEQVRLRDETVTVERRPVGETVGRADANMLRDRTVEMTERDEEAVVDKRAVVKEEVVLRKDVNERVERIDDTVRRTEVEVDRLAAGDKRTDRPR